MYRQNHLVGERWQGRRARCGLQYQARHKFFSRYQLLSSFVPRPNPPKEIRTKQPQSDSTVQMHYSKTTAFENVLPLSFCSLLSIRLIPLYLLPQEGMEAKAERRESKGPQKKRGGKAKGGECNHPGMLVISGLKQDLNKATQIAC